MRLARVFCIAVLMSCASSSLANHILGGNISYDCLGGNSYGVTLSIYKDCFGATAAPSMENLFFFPSGCGLLPFSATSNLTEVVEVSDLCPSELANSSCNGGFIPGVELIQYYIEVTLDPSCVWEISWSAGDWNYFQNMDNSTLPSAYLRATVDPSVGCYDSVELNSDVLNSTPVPYSCTGDAVSYILDVDNPNGYTLSYGFTCPLTGGGANAPMTEPCTETIPGITIDPLTGQIDFISPAAFGNYLVGVEIQMFDGVTYIGSVFEDIAFTVRLCDTSSTVFTLPEIQWISAGGNQISDTEAEVCVGDSLCINVEASNTNIFRTITLTSDFATLFPGADFIVTGINPVNGELCLIATESMIGSTVVTIDAEDDACPVQSTDQIQITITVLPSLSVDVLDTLICLGELVPINATGDSDFQWNVVTGDPDPGIVGNGGSQTLDPLVDTQIEIIANNATATCNFRDTLNIAVSLSALNVAISDETCNGNDGEIDLTVVGGSGDYSFNWPAVPAATEDVTGLIGGTYSVEVTDNLVPGGCTRDTLITVGTVPPPSGSISGDLTICEGECAEITFTTSGTGPFTAQLFNQTTSSLEGVPAVNDLDTYEVCPATTTTYTLQSLTDSNVPSCTSTTPSSVTITVRPYVNASFDVPANICVGENIDLVLSIDQAGSYDVVYDPSGVPASPLAGVADGQLINVSPVVSTDYSVTSVQYQDAPFCTNTAVVTTTLNVDLLPTAEFAGDITICAGEASILHLSLTGTGPWEIYHDYAAEPSPILTAFNEFDWLLTSPGVTTTITLSSVVDLGTNCSQLLTETATITVNPLPTGTLTPDATICNGDDQVLTFNLNTDGPFDIQYTDDGTPVSEIGVADGFQIIASPNANAQYCLFAITDANGCEATAVADCADIIVNDIPTLDITGTTLICEGDCFDVPFNNFTGNGPFEIQYEITAVDDGASIGGVQTASGLINGDFINVCPDESVEVTILSVSDSNAPTCSNTTSSVFTITVNTYSVVNMAMDSTICAGDCGSLLFDFQNAIGPVNITYDATTLNGLDLVADMIDSVYTATECPAVTTTYTLTLFTDDGNICTQIGTNSVTLTVAPLPDLTLDADIAICPGESTDLIFNVNSGTGPFDVTVNVDDGTLNFDDDLTGVVDGDLYGVTPSESTTYTITSIIDQGAPTGCTVTPNSITTVTINELLQISNVDTLCVNMADSFQYVFEITGGDPATYIVDIPGVLDDGTGTWVFTSDPLDPATGTVFTVTDGEGCGPAMSTIDPFVCPVLTYSGTVDLEPLIVCEDAVLTIVPNGNEILDDDDVLSFVIHDNPASTLGIVYYVNNIPTWDVTTDLDLPGTLSYGVTYYVSAVAGDDDGGGMVNLGNPNISVSQGTPVVFIESPEADINGGGTICEGETVEVFIDFTNAAPWTFSYQLDGLPVGGIEITDIAVSPYVIDASVAGSYTLVSVSSNGCDGSVSGNADVIVNPLPTGSLSADGSFCEGSSYDLNIDLTGTPDWDVTIGHDDGDGYITFSTQTYAATPGVFTVTDSLLWFVDSIEDGNGCVNDADGLPVVVTIDPLPTATYTFADTSLCTGSAVDLFIDLTGSGPWTLAMTNAGIAESLIANTSPYTLTVTAGGDYVIDQVTDDNGCLIIVNNILTVSETPILLVDAGADIELCSGDTGIIGTADNPAYSYEWDPAEGLDDNLISSPSVSLINETGADVTYTYSVVATEGYCSETDEVDVVVHPVPPADAGEDVHICYGSSVTLQATGGTDYAWVDNGEIPPAELNVSNPTVTPLATTQFNVIISDANSCSAEDSVMVFVPTEFLADEVFTADVCFEICDGEIELTPSGGWTPYAVDWVDPILTDELDLVGLCTGTYAYSLTDSIGCEVLGVIFIGEFAEYFFEDVIITPPTCFGDDTGQLDVISAQADTFELNVDETNNTGIFTNLEAGDYSIQVIDTEGCLADTTVSFTSVSEEISISIDFEELVICVGDEVHFNAEAIGGDGTFTYNWYDGIPPVGFVSNDNPYILNLDQELTLYVVAEDGLGCDSEVLTNSAIFNPAIEIDIQPGIDIEICQGECIDLIAVPSGGTGDLEITWISFLNNVSDTIAYAGATSVCPLESIAYIALAEDGCSYPEMDTVFVTVFETPVVQFEPNTYSGCYPYTVVFTNLTDPTLSENCLWDFGDGNTLAICEGTSFVYAEPGEYYPSLTVTSAEGCTDTDTLVVPITIYDYPSADFTWTPNPVNTLEEQVQLINLSTDAVLFEWNFGGVGASIEANPEIQLPIIDNNVYEICLIATSPYGCADETCHFIVMESNTLVYVPNAFTPDLDGLNDVFTPITSGVSSQGYHFKIWDRWGTLVFHTTQLEQPWIGEVLGSGYYAPNDVYFWQVEVVELSTGEVRVFEGRVTLLR
jgi:gliding motility-associated-like protein